MNRRLIVFFICLISLILPSCDFKKSDKAGGSYVKPSVNYKGQTRKGHVRKKVSTDKNAILNQNRSRYYYETRGKVSEEISCLNLKWYLSIKNGNFEVLKMIIPTG